MCGIAGFLDTRHTLSPDTWNHTLTKMGEAIIHRGPDAGDIWHDLKDGIGFSHRRLSILDLSSAGAQPMTSHSGRFVIIFNGEIYNHLDIRLELNNINWRGFSDTETLLAGFDIWGIEKTLTKTVGMFALAVWDKQEKILYLTRDRLGEKPLYYSIKDGLLIFGSELKAILAHPLFLPEIDREALNLYTQYSYVPTPYSIYKNTKKLEQGSILTIQGTNLSSISIKKYWDLNSFSSKCSEFTGSDSEAIETLENKILESVKMQQLSDVPLGAFLSGGVDSSTVVALMQKSCNNPIKTFTIGFDDPQYDESRRAMAIAKHIGTDHSELIISDKEIQNVIPLLPQIYDEPFADSSQIPTYLISQFAKKQVTVSLSGDGGDELFCGYNRYLWTEKIHNYPYVIRNILKPFLELINRNKISKHLAFIPFIKNQSLLDEKLAKLIAVLGLKNDWEIYQWLIRIWNQEDGNIVLGTNQKTPIIDISSRSNKSSLIEQLLLYDMQTYLPDDNLHKLDRAGMANSLESRIPLLDHRIVEFAIQLPMKYKFRNNSSKWILRQILYKHVPKELIEGPKKGFSVPINSWLRGPIKEWAESLLNESSIKQYGFLDYHIVNRYWKEHIDQHREHGDKLWNILMFQAWLTKYHP